MFTRVVSNFRRKSKSSRKLFKTPISSAEDEFSSRKNQCGRVLPLDFNLESPLRASLSDCDSDCCEKQNKSLSLSLDKSQPDDSGANDNS